MKEWSESTKYKRCRSFNDNYLKSLAEVNFALWLGLISQSQAIELKEEIEGALDMATRMYGIADWIKKAAFPEIEPIEVTA